MPTPDELEADAEAVLRVLDLAKIQRATRSSAEFDEGRVKGVVARIRSEALALRINMRAEDAARKMRARERGEA